MRSLSSPPVGLARAVRAASVLTVLAVSGACASGGTQGTLLTLDQMRARAAADSAARLRAAGADSVRVAARTRNAPAERATLATADTIPGAQPRRRERAEVPAPRAPIAAPVAAAPAPLRPVQPEPAPIYTPAAPVRTPVRQAAQDPPARGRWITPPAGRTPPIADISVYERPLADVLSLISARADVAIVPSDEQQVREKLVTAEIRGYPWHIALEALLSAHGLRAVQEPSGIITVVTAGRAEVARNPMPVRLRYLYARDFEAALSRVVAAGDSSQNGGVEVFGDPETSRDLIVYASADRLAQVRALVDSMDRRPPTITVEARLVSVNRSRMQRLGFQYAFVPFQNDSTGRLSTGVAVQQNTTPSGGLTSENGPAFRTLRRLAGLGTLRLDVFVDAVSGNGIGETETTPLITATSGIASEIMVGDQFILPNPGVGFFGVGGGVAQPALPGGGGGAYPGGQGGGFQQGQQAGSPAGQQLGGLGGGGQGGFSQFETGTRLRVTPYALGGGYVRMKIELTRDGGTLDPAGRSITGGKQTATTEVTVLSEEPVVIGGLTVNSRSRTNSGVPLLSDLPVIGRAFRNEQWAENYNDLVIIVTPRLHPDGSVTVSATGY